MLIFAHYFKYMVRKETHITTGKGDNGYQSWETYFAEKSI